MADNKPTSAQNKLGQLYVDLGLNGLGGMLNGLNKVSAQFLLTKNAAQQFIRPIVSTIDSAGKSAIEFKKLSIALGTTEENIMSMHYWLKQHGMSDFILSDMEKITKSYAAFYQGIQNLPDTFVQGLQKIGLNALNYTDSFESMLQLIEDVRQNIQNLPAAEQRNILSMLGLSEDFLYAFEKLKTSSFKDMPNILSKEDVDNAIKAEEAMLKLRIDVEQKLMKVIADNVPLIVDAIQMFTQAVDFLFKGAGGFARKWKQLDENNKKWSRGEITYEEMLDKNLRVILGTNVPLEERTKVTTPIASVPLPNGLNTAPEELAFANASNMGVYNNNMTINQNIVTDNPVLAANLSSEKIAQAERNAYEGANLGMV